MMICCQGACCDDESWLQGLHSQAATPRTRVEMMMCCQGACCVVAPLLFLTPVEDGRVISLGRSLSYTVVGHKVLAYLASRRRVHML
jgi:hypothetical protein